MEQCRIHRTLLALPDYVFPAVMLVLGRPTQQQKARPKPGRCGLKHIVHENGYRRMDTGELRQMLAWKAEERPYADWLRAFCDRKYDSGFSREMTRSVEEYLSSFRGGRIVLPLSGAARLLRPSPGAEGSTPIPPLGRPAPADQDGGESAAGLWFPGKKRGKSSSAAAWTAAS